MHDIEKNITSTGINKIGIIAGSGEMPNILINACKKSNIDVCAVAYKEQTNNIPKCDHIFINIGDVSNAISYFKQNNIKHIVMIGGITRPSLKAIIPDVLGVKLLSKIGLKWLGDNSIMTIVAKFLEEQGFNIIGIQDIFPTTIATKDYSYGLVNETIEDDINLGIKILSTLDTFDFGQGIAIQNGIVLAIEAAEGTDECIIRTKNLILNNEIGPVYVKYPKKQQDKRIDLPTIGPKTIDNLFYAGFSGIAFSSYNTIIVQPEITIEKAIKNNIFLYVS